MARLTGLRAVAREQLVEARLGQGESAVLVPEIEGLVADDPMREERWRLLVLALYRAHRQADALAALRRARTTLSDELGVDPGPALRALEAEVLAQSPSLDAPARPAGRRDGRRPRPAGRPTGAARAAAPTPPGEEIVDRDRELLAAAHRTGRGDGRAGAAGPDRGAGRDRQEPTAAGGTPAGRRRGRAGADGARAASWNGTSASARSASCSRPPLADPADRADLLRGAAAAAAWVFGDIGSADAGGPRRRLVRDRCTGSTG